ncbi:MAG: site-2 protease family protein [Deltaproteobacteria bacterium]|nr:site-2 protease family protein [Deltaproteobacteria bacterium]
MSALLDYLLAILGISLLVIVHEGGHYLAARAFGMRVIRFSIGFGPTLFKYRPKGSPTTFQVAAIPFLAYVQIAGMNPQEDVEPDDPELFPNKGVFARIITIFAGPFANYLAASVVFFGIALAGIPIQEAAEPMTVESVEAGSAAADAGIQAGDVIVEANGGAVRDLDELIAATRHRAGQATVYVVERDGTRLDPIRMTPHRAADGRGIIGVHAKLTRTYAPPMSVGAAALLAVKFPYRFSLLQLEGLKRMITAGDHGDIKGPVGMGKLVAQEAHRGPIDYLYIIVVISTALGMFNLLPIPALDGGRLVFLGYELVTRSRPNERFEATVHTVGLLFLLGVLVLVTFRDIWG